MKEDNLLSGPMYEVMPRVKGELILPEQILEERINTINTEDEEFWWSRPFTTSAGVLYHPDGRIKIVRDAEIFLDVDQPEKLPYLNVLLGLTIDRSIEVYENIEGLELNKEESKKYMGDPYKNAQPAIKALHNPVWRELINFDMLKTYLTIAEHKYKKTHERPYKFGIECNTPQSMNEANPEFAKGNLITVMNYESISGLCVNNCASVLNLAHKRLE